MQFVAGISSHHMYKLAPSAHLVLDAHWFCRGAAFKTNIHRLSLLLQQCCRQGLVDKRRHVCTIRHITHTDQQRPSSFIQGLRIETEQCHDCHGHTVHGQTALSMYTKLCRFRSQDAESIPTRPRFNIKCALVDLSNRECCQHKISVIESAASTREHLGQEHPVALVKLASENMQKVARYTSHVE